MKYYFMIWEKMGGFMTMKTTDGKEYIVAFDDANVAQKLSAAIRFRTNTDDLLYLFEIELKGKAKKGKRLKKLLLRKFPQLKKDIEHIDVLLPFDEMCNELLRTYLSEDIVDMA